MQQQHYNDHQGASPSALQQQRPLTRYLPIRGDGFDLRQHIETAGHQVELCPHVMLTSTSARGYLHKMGSRFRTWNKRWFVFDRTQRTFLYYSDKTETRKRSGAYFQVFVLESRKNLCKYFFRIWSSMNVIKNFNVNQWSIFKRIFSAFTGIFLKNLFNII